MNRRECRNRFICLLFCVTVAVLSIFYTGKGAEDTERVFNPELVSSSFVSLDSFRNTQASEEELTGLRLVSERLEAEQNQRYRSDGKLIALIMLAVLLTNTVFYTAKKRLLDSNAPGVKHFIISYIYHQDGKKR